VSTWRPEPSREPQLLAASLDRLAARLGAGSARGLGALYERWEEVVGVPAAAHATPGGVRGGRLVIEVDHPAWATSLAHLQGTLLRRVAEVAGPDLVQAIEVRVRPR
jgi:predicted nucleic acid-binding Zn ribbon protein